MLEKRRILEVVSLNRVLGDVTLDLEKRKPFDELAKRPSIQLSRGNKTPIELFRPSISEIKTDVAGLIRDATPDFTAVYKSQSTA